ncbi:MAG: GNAT family N-acetyltransferase [Oligoflexia bacterium]|nr:GNAT family N-acetyltransferase [Oligoflexia bacterium]
MAPLKLKLNRPKFLLSTAFIINVCLFLIYYAYSPTLTQASSEAVIDPSVQGLQIEFFDAAFHAPKLWQTPRGAQLRTEILENYRLCFPGTTPEETQGYLDWLNNSSDDGFNYIYNTNLVVIHSPSHENTQTLLSSALAFDHFIDSKFVNFIGEEALANERARWRKNGEENIYIYFREYNIRSVCTNQRYQNKGLGTKLMHYMIENLKSKIDAKTETQEESISGKKRNIYNITLSVKNHNTSAYRFYKRLGFQDYYQEGPQNRNGSCYMRLYADRPPFLQRDFKSCQMVDN